MTPKQEKFVAEYLVDLNATAAAKRAGYSEKTAQAIGAENLKKPVIKEAIEAAMNSRSERTEITQDRILAELARIGFSDLRKLFTDNGALLPPEEWPDDAAAAVSFVEVTTRPSGERDENGRPIMENVHKFRLWDKNSALEKLGKHLGMFVDRSENTNTIRVVSAEPMTAEEWAEKHAG